PDIFYNKAIDKSDKILYNSICKLKILYSEVDIMAKDMKLALLLDFYGGLLTEKQESALDGYYNQDLSLAEIAEEMGISRQGVMAFLKQGEKHLRSFEEKLGLAERFSEISRGLDEMRELAGEIPKETERERLTGLIDKISSVI
ncbi:MAG: YlxM family DNA-binding protein, partial [Candidatus Ornithomonoglobus sp.]